VRRRLRPVYRSPSSEISLIPFLCCSAAVLPLPEVGFPENEPSYILSQPQEGLPALPMNSVIPNNLAIFNVSSAPWTNCAVTSLPSLSTTRLLLLRTLSPLPSWISFPPVSYHQQAGAYQFHEAPRLVFKFYTPALFVFQRIAPAPGEVKLV